MSELYLKKPLDFGAELEVSTIFMENEDRLLLLLRRACPLSPQTWGVPGGKLENSETPLQGILREIDEELSLQPRPNDLRYLNSLYVRHPRLKYILHLFGWLLNYEPTIKINPREHLNYLWQPISQISELPLLEGQLDAIRFIYNRDT